MSTKDHGKSFTRSNTASSLEDSHKTIPFEQSESSFVTENFVHIGAFLQAQEKIHEDSVLIENSNISKQCEIDKFMDTIDSSVPVLKLWNRRRYHFIELMFIIFAAVFAIIAAGSAAHFKRQVDTLRVQHAVAQTQILLIEDAYRKEIKAHQVASKKILAYNAARSSKNVWSCGVSSPDRHTNTCFYEVAAKSCTKNLLEKLGWFKFRRALHDAHRMVQRTFKAVKRVLLENIHKDVEYGRLSDVPYFPIG